jgi:hypothetical protein
MKIYIFSLLLVFQSLSTYSQNNFRSEIKYLNYDEVKGKIFFEVVGYGSKYLKAERDVMENLFSTIFFRGIPNSPSLKPLIGYSEKEIISSNKTYFQSFFDKKRYLTFLNEKDCSVLSNRGKRRKLKCFISVDIQALRDDLRINKLISDYGF